jgi:hypothetical protein
MHPFIFSATGSGLTAQSGGLTAALPAGSPVRLAHFGCSLLGNLRKTQKDRKTGITPPPLVPRGSPLDVLWSRGIGPRWASTDDATGRLGRELAQAAQLAGVSGLILWDTMRNGSDYWRPGNLLTKAADQACASRSGLVVSYAREDELCPPPALLDAFNTTAMTFGQYAQSYADYLRQGSADRTPPVELGAAAVITAQAQGRLAAFYCTDPYIPGFGEAGAFLTGTPYDRRRWLDQEHPALRQPGCHRVVLAEEVARFFRESGMAVEVLEVEQTVGGCHRRSIAAPA